MESTKSTNGGPTPSGTDGSFASSDGFPKNDHISHQGESPPTTPSAPYSGSELVHYRQGFFCAIDTTNQPPQSFLRLLENLSTERDEALGMIRSEAAEQLMELEAEATAAQERVSEAQKETTTTQAEESLSEREQAAKQIDDSITRLRKELDETQRELVQRRDELLPRLIQERLNDAVAEGKQVIDGALELSRARQAIGKQAFEDSRLALEERAQRLNLVLKSAEETRGAVNEMLNRLERSGLTRTAVGFLTSIGTVSLLATGWFFSVFAANGKFDSDDYFSFVVARILSALDARFTNAEPAWLLLAAYVGGWLLLLLMVWGVFSAVQWWIARGQPKIVFALGDEALVLREPAAPVALSAWLRFAPLIFVVGVVFLLLSFLGPRENDLDRLLRSLSGQFVGSVLGLLATALFVLYIVAAVEPRFRASDRISSGWRQHWELLIAFGATVVVASTLLVWQLQSPESATAAHPTTSLAWFLSSLLLTMPTLGYGVWARGVFTEVDWYDERIRRLGAELDECLRPKNLDTSPIDNRVFRNAWAARQARLVELMDTRSLNLVMAAPMSAGNLAMIEQTFLPDIRRRIDDLELDLRAALRERDSLRSVRATETPVAQGPSLEEVARNELRRIRRDRQAVATSTQVRLKELRVEFLRRENALRDGFNLGLWHRRIDVHSTDRIDNDSTEATWQGGTA